MKKFLLATLCLGFVLPSFGQAPDEVVVDVLGKGIGKFSQNNITRDEASVLQGIFAGTGGDTLEYILTAKDGTHYLVGTLGSEAKPQGNFPVVGKGRPFIAQLSANGRQILRMLRLPDPFLSARRIDFAPDGSVVVAGEKSGGGLQVARLSPGLDTLAWNRSVIGDTVASVSVAPDESVVVCPTETPFVSRISPDGKTLMPFGTAETFRTDAANPAVHAAWWLACGYEKTGFSGPRYHRGGSGGVVATRDGEFVLLTSNFVKHPGGGPDFDLMMLRFNTAGEIVWCTNLLEGLPAESDHKSPQLARDPHSDDLLVGAIQHGHFAKNLLVTPGAYLGVHEWLTGNIMIGWIGRVDASSGTPKAATFYFPELPGPRVGGKRRANSLFPKALTSDSAGNLYVTGGTAFRLPTTLMAFQTEPLGGCGFVSVFNRDLTRLLHSSLITSKGMNFSGGGIALAGGAPLVIGKVTLDPKTPAEFVEANAGKTNYLSAQPLATEGAFVGYYPAFKGNSE